MSEHSPIKRSDEPLPGLGELAVGFIMAMDYFPGRKVLVHVAQLVWTIASHRAVLGGELVHPLYLLPGNAGKPVGEVAQGCVYRTRESVERVELDRIHSSRCQVKNEKDCRCDGGMV